MRVDFYECCHYCKPPKRKPGCQDHCPDKAKANAKFAKRKAEYAKEQHRDANTVCGQRTDAINKIIKNRPKKRRSI